MKLHCFHLILIHFGIASQVLWANHDTVRVFRNAQIVTMRINQLYASAMAVQGERIVWLGMMHEIPDFSGNQVLTYDLEGQTVIPGFVDAHTHLFNDQVGGNLEGSQAIAFKNGITTLGNMFTNEDFLVTMEDFENQGLLKVKTSLYLIHNTNCGLPVGDWYLQYAPTRKFGERLRIGGVKIFVDGGTCGRAALSFPRPDGDFGDIFYTQEDLNQVLQEIEDHGHQAAIHAIGDSAIRLAQNAVAFALQGSPNHLRHRIDHNVIIKPDLISRYSEIGIIPVIFGWQGTCHEANGTGWIRSVGYERRSYIFPIRELINANPDLPIAWHGDDPWVGPISPLEELYHMVTRKEILEDGTECTPPEWMVSSKLTAFEALKMMTMGSAFALDREKEVGSLDTGKIADLVILSANPLDIDPEKIRDIEIKMTMANGEKVYGAFPTLVTSNQQEDHLFSTKVEIHPNPLTQSTSIHFRRPITQNTDVQIRNLQGVLIQSFAIPSRVSNGFTITWHRDNQIGDPVPAGLYLCTIKTPGQLITYKLVCLD